MDLPDHYWALLKRIRAQCRYSKGQVQPLVSLWFRPQNHRFQVSSGLLGFLSPLFFFFFFFFFFFSIPRNNKSLDIATITRQSSSIPGFILSCLLNLDSSNPSTSSNTSMCSEWSLSPLIAFEMSDHTPGNSALSGLRFFMSISRFGGRYDHIMFPFREQSHNRIHKLQSIREMCISRRQCKHGSRCSFSKAPSFRVFSTSPIDSRISFIAGHTAALAVEGSLSVLRKLLLCRWSLMPANTIVIEFISVCFCTPIAIDTDCIRSRSTAAKIITSGQNRDLEVYTKSELAPIIILALLISALSYAAKMVSSFFIAFNSPYLWASPS